jgi:hypothetical protein
MRPLLGSLWLVLLSANSGVAAEEHEYGEYVCFVEQAAGMQLKDDWNWYSAKITLPEDEKKFDAKAAET